MNGEIFVRTDCLNCLYQTRQLFSLRTAHSSTAIYSFDNSRVNTAIDHPSDRSSSQKAATDPGAPIVLLFVFAPAIAHLRIQLFQQFQLCVQFTLRQAVQIIQ
jgi:hypothetical protein